MHWEEFENHAPELAQLARERIEQDQVILLGTIRKDGSPRISPVEPDIANGRLYLGMIWESYKARDLQRDPRCTVHGLIHDRFATGGEIKLRAKAIEIEVKSEREIYREAIFKRIDFKPEEPKFHLFAIDIQSAAKFSYEDDARVIVLWREGEPVKKYRDYMDGRREEFD